MKNLKEFINEAKNFKLSDNERQAFSEFIGLVSENIGDQKDWEELKCINYLKDDEVLQLRKLHDCLDDNQTYKSINRNNIKDDIQLIKKVYKLANDNDLLKEKWDLMSAFEKICL